jgi:hypothetical protein
MLFSRIIILSALLGFFTSAIAQNASPINNTNSNIIPPPPNVASFLKVADLPVSAYNGTGQVTIPLYTLEIGDLKVPISASYYNNGLKVNEEASWIGFGWNLNAGGVIHQNIVGNPDPVYAGSPHASASGPLPLDMPPISNSDIQQGNRLEHGCTFLDNNYNQQLFTTSQLVDNGFNTLGNKEYDLYLYNFGGYSGKFIYPNYPTTAPVLLDRNNIKFEYDGVNYTATTPDGAQYVFSSIGRTDTNKGGSCGTNIGTATSYSWYLTKITSPNGNTVTFVYSRFTSNSLPSLSQSYTESAIGGSGNYLQSQGFVNDFNISENPGSSGLTDNTTYSTSQQENLILDSIKSANATIVFKKSAREDVSQGVKLDNISIFRTGESTPFRGINFNYDYFLGSTLFGDWTTNSNVQLNCGGQGTQSLPSLTLAQRSERLKLKSIQVLGSNSQSEPPYQFIYDSSPLPYKTSLAQDLWGYFNGENNNSLLPDYSQMGYFDNNVPINLINGDFKYKKKLAVRKAAPRYMQAGILKQIINPTGGYTKFTYEPNHFSDLPASSNQIRDTTLYVTDSKVGNQQIIFTVPDIGYQGSVYVNGAQTVTSVNPAFITVTLASPNSPCICGPGISGYVSSSSNPNGLYAILEQWDAVNSVWSHTENNIFDFVHSQWQNPTCSNQIVYSSTIPESLVPGKYRIVVSYPDSQTGGLPQPSASASIQYKYISSQQYLNYGGGLRVKSVVEHTDATHIYNQKVYTYYSGRLMTKPIFYRNTLSYDMEARATILPNEPSANLGGVFMSCGSAQVGAFPNQPMSQNPLELSVTSLTLFSNPLLNYSYGASGAAVGYDSVKVDYSIAQDIGQTVYNYINVQDNVNYYPEMLPGIPGGSYILNGSLASQKEFKNNGNGTLSLLKEEDNTWIVNNFQDYWAYKTEYIQPYSSCKGQPGPVEADGVGLYYNYLHFYPVKAGKVLLNTKATKYYDSATPYVESTVYRYNSQNQLSTVTTSKSGTRVNIRQTYYPGDYTVTSGFLSAMQAKNMIDYPIEVINNVTNSNNTQNTLTSAAVYNEFYVHDNNIVSPSSTYNFNSIMPVAIIGSAPSNTKDSHYQLREVYSYDQYGNELTNQKANGPVTRYLWDYNNLYPVAKTINSTQGDFAYTSFEGAAKGNWGYSGSATSDPASPTGLFCYNLSNGSITANNLIASKTYLVSYWTKTPTPLTIAGTSLGYPIQVKTLNGWYNFQHKITAVTGVTISGSGYLDELRLYPLDAQMETFTYQPMIGLSSSTDSKGKSTYYSYDNLQNLLQINNSDGDILKQYTYHYAGYYSGMTPFTNVAMSQSFSSNICQAGMGASPVTYSVSAGTYPSYVSQAAANDMAQSDLMDNGQNYANANSGCVNMPCSAGGISSANKTGGLSYAFTYGTSVGTSVIVRVYNSSGSQVAPPQNGLTTSGGTVTGTVPSSGTYTFQLTVYGDSCPNGVTSNTVSIVF